MLHDSRRHSCKGGSLGRQSGPMQTPNLGNELHTPSIWRACIVRNSLLDYYCEYRVRVELLPHAPAGPIWKVRNDVTEEGTAGGWNCCMVNSTPRSAGMLSKPAADTTKQPFFFAFSWNLNSINSINSASNLHVCQHVANACLPLGQNVE